eukprot:scaffold276011_cov48-Prasinocladus_malaysianus.AAC.1
MSKSLARSAGAASSAESVFVPFTLPRLDGRLTTSEGCRPFQPHYSPASPCCGDWYDLQSLGDLAVELEFSSEV